MQPDAHACATFLECVLDWTEKHAGLGGWVGAIGSVVAIFAAWGLARAEYRRSKKEAKKRHNAEILLIISIIERFDEYVSAYKDAAFSDKPEARYFYNKHLNEPEFHAAIDLAHIPVSQWPSLASNMAFFKFWFTAIKLLETSNADPIDKEDLKTRAKVCEDLRVNLVRRLQADRL